MNNLKKNVLVLIGGPSTEHKVSLRSGNSVISTLDNNKYNVFVVGITLSNEWKLMDKDDFLINEQDPVAISLKESDQDVLLMEQNGKAQLFNKNTLMPVVDVHVVFPVLHGSYGEDGTLQGILRSIKVPFVGVDLLASAIGMDKDISKRLWRDAGIPIADFELLTPINVQNKTFDFLKSRLGLPMFIKPANAGSSVGVHKVTSEKEYFAAIEDGFKYDKKLLAEEAIDGIEVECAVLGNEEPKASVIGGIKPKENFYSYDAKYISQTGADLMIPAEIPDDVSKKIQSLAIKAFLAIGCEGLSRVDFFLTKENNIIINEINTLPGFTSISMYPKLWEASGLPYALLLDQLIAFAEARFHNNKMLNNIGV